jgi:hypothetical protein
MSSCWPSTAAIIWCSDRCWEVAQVALPLPRWPGQELQGGIMFLMSFTVRRQLLLILLSEEWQTWQCDR